MAEPELTQEAVEAVAEAIPEFVESLTKMKVGFTALGIAIGGAIGGLIGFRLAWRRLEVKYATIAEKEIDEMREHFRARLVSKEIKPSISELGKRVESLGYVSPDTDQEAPGPGDPNTSAGVEDREDRNVFEEAAVTDNWDYEVEKAARTIYKPYVIHVDERGESGFEEVTLTYYMGDDVLCDEQDKVVDDQERVVGAANLDKFGHGSKDAAIVYVRNEYLHLDLEVVKSEQTYAEEVHGLKHADDPRRRERPEWR